jgi:hypothetical protein
MEIMLTMNYGSWRIGEERIATCFKVSPLQNKKTTKGIRLNSRFFVSIYECFDWESMR